MYPFVTHTWNAIKGKCPHDCSYCYMKRFGEQPDLHFDEKELKTDLGEGNFIFVGSSCDMFAWGIPNEWIMKTLNHCRHFFNNKYLFQTKNPEGLLSWLDEFKVPLNSIIGTTIETNRLYPYAGNAPPPSVRAIYMSQISARLYKTMVTIEPIMDFDLINMVDLVENCNPEWVNIGADSQKSNLPEPPPEKIKALISLLEKFTEVKIKPNLKRLLTT